MISFDLDDTLICLDDKVPKEPNKIPLLFRFLYRDPLRLGTIKLMNYLISAGWEIAVYTTSYRSIGYIRRLFRFYGIPIKKVINQEIHDREVVGESKKSRPSKLPSKFGIDLHVDDDECFISNAAQYGFDVVVVRPEDFNWTDKVIEKSKVIKHGI